MRTRGQSRAGTDVALDVVRVLAHHRDQPLPDAAARERALTEADRLDVDGGLAARVVAALWNPGSDDPQHQGAGARSGRRDDHYADRARERAITETLALSTASSQVSDSFESVSGAMGDMHESITEISRNTAHGAAVASAAVEHAEATSERVERLRRAAAEIDDIVGTIASITQQSHLLALNATIEAARVGEAGRGFAVVAGEVKELARRTAEAAEDIAARVGAVQDETARAAEAIESIRATIVEVHELQGSTAAAVEEQSAQAAVIADTCATASRGSAVISGSVLRLVDAQRLAHVSTALQSALGVVDDLGVALGDTAVAWAARDQFSGRQSEVVLPQLLIGGSWLGHNDRVDQPSPVVDDVVSLVGGTCTVLQRTPGGDLLRVATTVRTAEGKRAIGTTLPHRMPDGNVNVVVDRVLSGEPYYGEATVVGRTYVTAYAPLVVGSQVVGALYVGMLREG